MRPAIGWQAYVEDEAHLMVFDGPLWKGFHRFRKTCPCRCWVFMPLPMRSTGLRISSDTGLSNNAGAGHQVKVNKQAVTDTASLLYQTNWTGFAEMGLNGSNDFSAKVSCDTGQWREAIKIDHATGNVAIGSVWPQTKLHVDGPILPASYTSAALPSAGGNGAGALVFVTKVPSGTEMAYSDGTNWRSIRSGTIIA